MEPHFLTSTVELHWGFIVRLVGTSASQPAYPLPPPTTVVGAFMNPLARILGVGEGGQPRRLHRVISRAMECALRATLAASAGVLPGKTGVAVYEEPSRILGGAYKAGGSYEKAVKQPPYIAVQELLPVQGTGAASAPKLRLVLAWLLDLGKIQSCLDVTIGSQELESAAWSVYRVGSREGLVSTIEAAHYGGEELETLGPGERFESILYQPEECSQPLEARYTVIPLPTHPDYREASFITPTTLKGATTMLTPASEPLLQAVREGCIAVRPRPREYLALTLREVASPG